MGYPAYSITPAYLARCQCGIYRHVDAPSSVSVVEALKELGWTATYGCGRCSDRADPSKNTPISEAP